MQRASMPDTLDVLVVGGGPAGAAAATLLATRGHRVMLIEREPGNRHRIGETLLPGAMPVLHDLAVLAELELARFPRTTGRTIAWGPGGGPWDVRFSDNPLLPFDYAFHVDRSTFDGLLLARAEAAGATVLRGATALAVVEDCGRAVGARVRHRDGTEEVLLSRFVVDASGPLAVLGKQLTERSYDEKLRQIAYYSYWEDVTGPTRDREGHAFIEATSKGWFWLIPRVGTPDGPSKASVGLVARPQTRKEVRAMGTEAFYQAALDESPMLRGIMGAQSRRVAPVRAVADWTYLSQHSAGPGWFLTGDAANFLDPLLSSGCTQALLSAYAAAAALHTTLTRPDQEELATLWYDQLLCRMATETRALLRCFYENNADGVVPALYATARAVTGLPEAATDSQAVSFALNTLPGNPHPAVASWLADRGLAARPTGDIRIDGDSLLLQT